MVEPEFEGYLLLSQNGTRAVPISAESLADLETPLSAYWKLAFDQKESFLLESVTGGEQLARYSIIGVRPRVTLMNQKQYGRTEIRFRLGNLLRRA